jgi:hypothetical protein
MPWLVDGNNLLHALTDLEPEAGRMRLCRLLALLPEPSRLCVVFDGPAPPGRLAEQFSGTGIEVIFSGPKEADEIIMDRITANTAPRRLNVVSTDREIRKAARRRRCRDIRSDEFARRLVHRERRLASGPEHAAEPRQKREGLSPEETKRWLREFGLQ